MVWYDYQIEKELVHVLIFLIFDANLDCIKKKWVTRFFDVPYWMIDN